MVHRLLLDSLVRWVTIAGLSTCLLTVSFAQQETASRRASTTQATDQSVTAKQFPVEGILPKREVGALEFLERYPQFDGRGVTVAIFDTGVDPGAAGLQETSDGRPKIVDMIDGTGSGDVTTSTIRVADGQKLVGLTGRTLTVPSQWLQSTKEFHLGMKAAYEFFPQRLIPRLKKHRRETFQQRQNAEENKLRRALQDWKAEHPNPTEPQRERLKELRAQLGQLTAAGKAHEDPGPVFDCVVFHDGQHWRAAIDTDEDGDLTDETLLEDYRLNRHWATFPGRSELNFAVNVFDDGNLLSIVTDGGAHGTHVAGIVAGNFPAQPELNGIAPGAQIVSVKIGDTRLQTMETAAGIQRGLIAAVGNECDLVNMSYGEPTRTPNQGALIEQMIEIVDEHGIIFVAAAGNDGPALSTVGAPGATTSAILGVAAYVSPAMAQTQYSLRGPIDEGHYTFSAVGPTFDGDMGVDISAPGGAIAPVPNWTLNREQQMNGTSMASPNACGAIALLVSAAKANQIEYSPYSIRKALQRTARDIPRTSPLAQGAGLIQIPEAFKHLKQFGNLPGAKLRFDVRIGDDRGIYLRSAHEVSKSSVHRVAIRPNFAEKTANAEKLDFQLFCRLESTADWITVGQAMVVNASGENMRIEVDPTQLSSGVHFAEVLGFDSTHAQRGPLFRVPVTVIVPTQMETYSDLVQARQDEGLFKERLELSAGMIARRFLQVPDGATWMDVRLRRPTARGRRLLLLHTMQRLRGETHRSGGTQHYITLDDRDDVLRSVPVDAGHTIELCWAQAWWNLGATQFDYWVTFRGVMPDDDSLDLVANATPRTVQLSAPLSNVLIGPSASLTHRRSTLFPKSATIQPLSIERDRLPNGDVFQLLELAYKFEQSSPGRVTPRFPRTDDTLYDADVGPHVWQLFDDSGRLIHTDDIFPTSGTPTPRLEKGAYTLKLQIRSTDREALKQLRGMPCMLDRKLSATKSLKIFRNRIDALSRRDHLGQQWLPKGERVTVTVAPPTTDDLPDGFQDGDLLLGSIRYGKAHSSQLGPGHRPGGFPLVMAGAKGSQPTLESHVLSEADGSENEEALPNRNEGDIPNKSKSLREARLAFKVKQLESLGSEDDELFNQLADEILQQEPNHLPVLVARMNRLSAGSSQDDAKSAKKRIQAANEVIQQIDQSALRQHFGIVRDDAQQQEASHKQNVRRREVLINALVQLGTAQADCWVAAKHHDDSDAQAEEDPADWQIRLDATLDELSSWLKKSDKRYIKLAQRRHEIRGDFGLALEKLNKRSSANPSAEKARERIELYKKLDWTHLRDRAHAWLLRKKYEP